MAIASCGVLAAWPVMAQAPRAAPQGGRVQVVMPKADPQEKARFQIAVMEGVLETAVQRGAQMMSRQWRTVAPDMLFIGGTAQARGFRLDGYGIFFAVDVPAMRQSVMWTLRMLDREAGAESAVQSIRAYIAGVADPTQKKALEQAIRQIELQVSPTTRSMVTTGQAVGREGAPATQVASRSSSASQPASVGVAVPGEPDAMADPGEAYTTSVKNALVDAMLDYSQSLTLAPDEYLTVAARAVNARIVEAEDSGDVVTIFIRVKGSDLQALHTGKITREEAHKRVEVREY